MADVVSHVLGLCPASQGRVPVCACESVCVLDECLCYSSHLPSHAYNTPHISTFQTHTQHTHSSTHLPTNSCFSSRSSSSESLTWYTLSLPGGPPTASFLICSLTACVCVCVCQCIRAVLLLHQPLLAETVCMCSSSARSMRTCQSPHTHPLTSVPAAARLSLNLEPSSFKNTSPVWPEEPFRMEGEGTNALPDAAGCLADGRAGGGC